MYCSCPDMARFHTWHSSLDLTKGNGPKGNILRRIGAAPQVQDGA